MYWRILRPLGTTKWLLVAPLTAIKHKIKDGDPLSYMETKKMEKHDLLQRCNRMVLNFKQANMCSGLTIAVSVNGTMVWKKVFGVSDVENSYPGTSDWKLQIASISKLFTTHLMMRYVEKNPEFLNKSLHDILENYPKNVRIHLEKRALLDPNGSLSPDLIEYNIDENCPLPIFSLLAHTSGLTHHSNMEVVTAQKKFTSSTDAFNATKWLWAYFANFPASLTYCGRGLDVSYTSYGINLIGVILERVQPLSCQDLLRNLCAELNLHDTHLLELDEEIFDYKNGYNFTTSGGKGTSDLRHGFMRDVSIVYPSEGLISNVGDLVKFGEHYAAMFKRSSRVGQLSQETVEKMFYPWSGAAFPLGFEGYGLGWVVEETIKKITRCNTSDPSGRAQPKASLCGRGAGHGGSSTSSRSYLFVSFCQEGERRMLQLYPGANFVPPNVRSKQKKLNKIDIVDTEPDFRHQVMDDRVNSSVKEIIFESPAKIQAEIDGLDRALGEKIMPRIKERIRQKKEELERQLERFGEQHRETERKISDDQASGRYDRRAARELKRLENERYSAACAEEEAKYKIFVSDMRSEFKATVAREKKDAKAALERDMELAEIRVQDQLDFDEELDARYFEGEVPPMIFGTCEYDHNPEERDRPVLAKSEPKGNTVVVAAISNAHNISVKNLCHDITRLFDAYYFDDNFVQTPKPSLPSSPRSWCSSS